MSDGRDFHVVTVGWPQNLLDALCADIEAKSTLRFSHIAHPRHSRAAWSGRAHGVRFFRESAPEPMPPADPAWLASLEGEGVPTLHNMILGDRIVCRVGYGDALRYATFVARRLCRLLAELQPSAVIGGFDSLHGGLSLAVARHLGIPWFALHFSVIPPGFACFCDRMSPAARVRLGSGTQAPSRELAENAIREFEDRTLRAYAYAPPARSLATALARVPSRAASFARALRLARDRDFARFVEVESRYDPLAAVRQLVRSARARRAIATLPAAAPPPETPYILFGLHMQPESSIDVWAPFQSNQPRVVELLARSIPPTHRLLVKVHKSDVANHSRAALDHLASFPGVQLVHPAADTRALIERAGIVVAIQGTMGLEAALLGRPVITLGESPVAVFPSVRQAGRAEDLPALVREQLRAAAPERTRIVDAFVRYLAPFLPASHNDWRSRKTASEVDGFVRLFDALCEHLAGPADSAKERRA